MTPTVLTALARIGRRVHAQAGVLLRHEQTGTVVVTSTLAPHVAAGDVWLSPHVERPASGTAQLFTSPSDLGRIVPTSLRLALPDPVTGVLWRAVDQSQCSVMLVFCTEPPRDDVVDLLESDDLDVVVLLAPLLDSHTQARVAAAHLEAVVGALDQAVVVSDASSGLAEVNQAAAALFGLTAGQVPAHRVSEAMRALRMRARHPERIEARATELMTDPHTVVRQWLWSFDGSPSHLSVTTAPVPGATTTGRVWVFEDVSAERKLLEAEQRARTELARSEARVRMILENTSDVVFQTIAGMLQWVSPNVAEVLGYTPDELVGRVTTFLWHPDDLDLALAVRRKALEGVEGREVLRTVTKDGVVKWVEVALRPYTEPDGQRGTVGQLHDVTARVTAEDAARSSERQALELAAQFEEARNAAIEASLAKTTFLSRMSHELRTPLNAVIGFAQLLEMDDLTVEQVGALAHIRAGGKHLLSLINEILDISRIEAGRLPLSIEPIDVGAACATALDLVRPAAKTFGVVLVEPDPPIRDLYVQGDLQRVVQVLLNLVSNAVKYNHRHGEVHITCAELDDETVAITVSDTGKGISADHLDRLFQPFDRLGAESTDVEGTGIGLSLSNALAGAMHGHIDVVSEVSVGSSFTLVLPTGRAPSVPATSAADRPEAVGDGHVDVLYVEDNPQNTELMRLIVARREHATCRIAGTAEAGRREASVRPPDLVFLDLQLPDESGETVLQYLREQPTTATLPVVILTADASPGLRQRLLEAGADGFLTKPIDVAEVLRWIDRCTPD